MRLRYILGVPIVILFAFLAYAVEGAIARYCYSVIIVLLVFIWFVPDRIKDGIWRAQNMIEKKW